MPFLFLDLLSNFLVLRKHLQLIIDWESFFLFDDQEVYKINHQFLLQDIILFQQVLHRLDLNYLSLYLKKLSHRSSLILELIYQIIQNYLQHLP